MEQTVSIVVEGLVQGVFFRQTTKTKALEAGITGEVKNRSDGSVHILATGTEEQIKQLVDWCQTGPEHAVVMQVHVEIIPVQKFNGFNIVKGR
ncbi:MAG TPA: acylphosphatase [Chitinophagaceae bacterium]|nr:acylphosphatase [Chitinophagaceae bacterium]HUM66773.1 acylphosphatase [Chitinophagaceae bacterium]